MSSEKITTDLVAHLSDELQSVLGVHLMRAYGVVQDADLLTIPARAASNLSRGALMTMAASLLNDGRPKTRADVEAAVSEIVNHFLGQMRASVPQMIDLTIEGLAKAGARAA